ncbi:hypothetical protein HZY62_17590 [Maribacter polysiphoniae]|uniref:Erythromycin esterase n=1 Tax=Maribacter polysiphoniae TaxID=429344 RepID=A0A316E7T1_9FLAO|nr:hypothetical protein [Maribacter polysiphoniae]MBD1262415.1 hypothetical protein [Maribacter polysiphoniae]PWK26116.1 hypothetical protein LX92_00861 [Maribacter polysiphoniae]
MKTRTLFILVISIVLLFSCSSSKYVNYLKEHTEVVKMTDSLQFNSLDEIFYQNKLFLVGEVHEVETSPRIDFALFTQLNERIKIDVYLSEMDIAQAYYLQEYLKGSNELELKNILKEWPVYIGSISEQYRNKWVKMRTFYDQLPENSKFKLVGIDRIADFELIRKLLKEKLPQKYHNEIHSENDSLISWSKNKLNNILEKEKSQLDKNTLNLLRNIEYNISNYGRTINRDTFMYLNFKRLYKQNQWESKNIYGGFGFSHTLQAYSYTFAGRIKKDSTLPYTNKMVSLNTLYIDSKLTVDSRALPKFMQDKDKAFTRFHYSQDNRLFMYIEGIADYKKVTEPNTISLLKLDAKDSPYLNSTRGTKVKKLITIWDAYDIIDGTSTTDYAQYILLVRNADWIQPDEK